MTTKLTIRISLIRLVLGYAAKQGINIEDLVSTVGIDPLLLSSPDSRVSLGKMDRLFRQTMLITQDDNLGLHVGECSEYGNINIVGHISRNCRTIGENLIKIIEYNELLSDGFRMTLNRKEKGLVVIKYSILHRDVPLIRQHVEGIFSCCINHFKESAGRFLKPVEVRFKHKAPQDTTEHQRIFQAPVLFNNSMNAIVWKESFLDVPNVLPNPEFLALFEQHAKQLLSEIRDYKPFTKKIHIMLIKNIPEEFVSIKNIADELCMSVRNLQKKLKSENTTYSKIVEDIRKNIAVSHLKNRELSIAEIGYLLGFSEPKSFHRSFKRWTGLSPTEYRNTQFTIH